MRERKKERKGKEGRKKGGREREREMKGRKEDKMRRCQTHFYMYVFY